MSVQIIPILKDNYAYLMASNNEALIIDPGEAAPIIEVLEKQNLKLTHIVNTHHHWDHTDGNLELKYRYNCTIYGPEKEKRRIPGIDQVLAEIDVFTWHDYQFQIIETPGHTAGHICLFEPKKKLLFVGDTLFSMGCGGLFEGTPEQAWHSFEKLLALPDDTNMYCGHEYTLPNAKFCLKIEPDNLDLQKRHDEVKELRRQCLPTLPVILGTEKKTNIFLRVGSAQKFKEIRAFKDGS